MTARTHAHGTPYTRHRSLRSVLRGSKPAAVSLEDFSSPMRRHSCSNLPKIKLRSQGSSLSAVCFVLPSLAFRQNSGHTRHRGRQPSSTQWVKLCNWYANARNAAAGIENYLPHILPHRPKQRPRASTTPASTQAPMLRRSPRELPCATPIRSISSLHAAWLKPSQLGRDYTQTRGLRQASSSSASGEPALGWWSYSHEAVWGMDMRIDSMRPPVFRPKVVPRS